jgi:VanZ family protein
VSFSSRFLPVLVFASAVLLMSGPLGSSASTGARVVPLLEALGLSPAAAAAAHAAGRTVGHLVAYALAAVLALRAARGDGPATPARAAIAFLFAIVLAAADESLQSATRGRGGRLGDVLVDATGALLGLAYGLLRARRPAAAASPSTAPSDL